MYYYRFRYYDPEIGRFISEDPIGFKGQDYNLFRYGRNSAQNLSDHFGLYSFQFFLRDTAIYSGIAGTATAITPGTQVASIVFFGVASLSVGLEISLYSDNPYSDTIKEIVKMIIPVKEPFNLFTDEAIDKATDKIKKELPKKKDIDAVTGAADRSCSKKEKKRAH